MGRYAIVDKGVVTNVAEGEADWAAELGAVQSDEAQIGWLYDGKVFTDPTPPPEPPPTPRRSVRKLLVVDRIIAAGAANAALQGFAANPIAKLRFDAATDLWADDEDVIAFLQAIGLDPNAILAPE